MSGYLAVNADTLRQDTMCHSLALSLSWVHKVVSAMACSGLIVLTPSWLTPFRQGTCMESADVLDATCSFAYQTIAERHRS